MMLELHWHRNHILWILTKALREILKTMTIYPVMLLCAIPHFLYVGCQIVINRFDDLWLE